MYRRKDFDVRKLAKERQQRRKNDRRLVAIAYFGGGCSCGETNSAFLTIACGQDSKEIEVLCWNCLMVRRRPNGISKKFLKVMDVYGHQCNCCGERRERTLTLDHVRNDGGIERIAMYSHQILEKAIREADRTRYQILCWSCNKARALKGMCPHVSNSRT